MKIARKLCRAVVPRHQVAYVRSHPLALCFSVGLVITGLVLIYGKVADTGLIEESAISSQLPDWLEVSFACVYVIGGSLAGYGIVRAHPNAEAAGMSMISSVFAIYYVLAVNAITVFALTGFFVVMLAIGCALRAFYLGRRGDDVMVVEHDLYRGAAKDRAR